MTDAELTQLADDLARFSDEYLVNGLENNLTQFNNTQLIILVVRNRQRRNQGQLELVV